MRRALQKKRLDDKPRFPAGPDRRFETFRRCAPRRCAWRQAGIGCGKACRQAGEILVKRRLELRRGSNVQRPVANAVVPSTIILSGQAPLARRRVGVRKIGIPIAVTSKAIVGIVKKRGEPRRGREVVVHRSTARTATASRRTMADRRARGQQNDEADDHYDSKHCVSHGTTAIRPRYEELANNGLPSHCELPLDGLQPAPVGR
jgi:hypothetical protein